MKSRFSQPKEWRDLEDQITPPEMFYDRRKLMKWAGLGALYCGLSPWQAWAKKTLPIRKNKEYQVSDANRPLTPKELATSYNNFYEFSLDKSEVKSAVNDWKLKEWEVSIEGEVEKPQKVKVSELIDQFEIEERIYRFRCVEAWSMVVPWAGFPLAKLLEKVEPKSTAKYVEFETFSDPKIGPNISKLSNYPWPYTEGLRLDEAKNPLTLVTVGMYGDFLPKQNGAPIRLIVPWKYGFKSIKSIVKIRLTSTQPKTLWNQLAPDEYGFYANVNPNVDHARWSQGSERFLKKPEGFKEKLFPPRVPTLMFNGYEKQVAHLYKGMDLKKFY